MRYILIFTFLFLAVCINTNAQKNYQDFIKKKGLTDLQDDDNIHKLMNGYEIREANNRKFLFVLLLTKQSVKIIDSVEADENLVNYGRVFFDSPTCFYWAQEYKLFQPIYGKIIFKSNDLQQSKRICFIDADRKKGNLLYTDAENSQPKYFYLLNDRHIDTFKVNRKLLNLRYYRLFKVEKDRLILDYVESDKAKRIEMKKLN